MSNVYIRNNIVYGGIGKNLAVTKNPDDDRYNMEDITIDYNAYYQPIGVMISYPPCYWNYGWDCVRYTIEDFLLYQSVTDKDAHSIAADPLFNNVLNNDFSPIIGSFACTLSSSGSYVGALPCVTASDSDSDDMPDYWEIQYDLEPYNPADAGYDDDSDGLTNLEEFQMGTNPTDPDTDNDNIIDGSDNCPTTLPVNIAGTSFINIQSAYDSAANLDVILSQEEFLTGSLTFNNDISITLRGGYDCSFVANTGVTVIEGDLQINNGSIKIDSGRFKIE